MRRCCLALWMWLLPCLALAQGQDLYSGEVPVASQDEALRAEALSEALKQVLVKVSGDGGAAEQPALAEALAKPDGLLQAFYYRQEVDRSGATPRIQLYYVASFDPRAVRGLLDRAGLAQWARERPALVVWVAADLDGATRLLRDVEVQTLLRRGTERGLNLKTATLDADEQAAGRLADIEARALGNLKMAAARYNAPGVLAGRLYRTADGVLGRFQLSDGERDEGFEVRATDASAALRDAADRSADLLAQRYAFAAADSTPARVEIAVQGLRSATDFGRVLNYLRSLSVVQDLDLDGAENDQLRASATVAGGEERLRQLVSLGEVLNVVGASRDGVVVLQLN